MDSETIAMVAPIRPTRRRRKPITLRACLSNLWRDLRYWWGKN